MHPNSVLLGVVQGSQKSTSLKEHHQLQPRNGWPAVPVASHGIGVWQSLGEAGRLIQQQLANGWMGVPPCNTQIFGVGAPHPGACPQAQTERDMPDNPTPHCRRGELHDGHPFALIWE